MTMRGGRGALFLALALGVGAPPLVGQDASGTAGAAARSDTLRLSLEQAWAIAEGHNPTYLRSVNDLALIPPETRETWANQILPSASLTLFNTGYTGNLRRIAEDPFGNPIERDAEWVYFSNTSQSLNLNWSIQGASLWNAFRRQERSNLARELAVERAGLQTRTTVRRQFFDVLEQRSLLEVERALERSRRVDLEAAERLFALARTSRVDVLNAQLALEQQAIAVQRQERAWEQALLELRTTLGDGDLPPLRLEDEPLPVFDPAGLDAGALVERAQRRHPDAGGAVSAVASADLGVREAKTAWWPRLSFGWSLSRRAQLQEQEALFDVSFDEKLDQNFFLSLSMPFFSDYFGNRSRIEAAEVQLDDERHALRETRLELEREVRTQVVALRDAWQSLRLARRAAEIADEALRLAREEYRLGTRSFEDLQTQVDAEADARRQVTDARYRFVDALISLEQAVGGPIEVPPGAELDRPVVDPAGGR